MQMPLLSVLMTAYNREKYLAEAIDSVLTSTYSNFELIIVDDCSKDSTLQIMEGYQKKDSRIHIYFNEQNLGDYANRNKAASLAKGEYIMYVDSDDKTFDFSFEYCINKMLEDQNVDLGMLCFTPELFGKILYPLQSINYHFNKKQFLTVGPGGTILKKSFFDKIGGYPEKYGPANDMYFNLKAASSGNIKCLEKVFLFYREHDGQEKNNVESYIYNSYLYMQDALHDLPLNLSEEEIKYLLLKNKRRFIVNTFKYFLSSKNITKTRQIIKKAKFSFRDFIGGIFQI